MPSPSSLTTNSGFANRVKTRDGHVCVFCSSSDPEAAHIFPRSTSKKRDFFNLNNILGQFWSHEDFTKWRNMYEDAGIAESAKNGISMNRQLHFWFDSARFALEPLRPTEDGIVVKWHWLKRGILKPLSYVRPDADIFHQAGITDLGWGEDLAHRASGVKIRTGQIFLLRRHEEMPDWDLLKMQWNLRRVASICGAADVTDDYYDYEDPDERGYDEAVAAKQRAIIAGQAVTGQSSMLAQEVTREGTTAEGKEKMEERTEAKGKEETKEGTTAKGKEETEEEAEAKGKEETSEENEEGRAADDTCRGNDSGHVDDHKSGSEARRG